jgi:mycothiol synthase
VIVRRPAAADLESVLALVRAADEAVIGESDWTESDLREEWERLDLERDAWLVELDGRLAGYATFEDRGGGRLVADGYVHPGLRGRGVGSELLRASEERARARADSVAETRVALQNATIETDACTSRLYERRGYAPVRWFWKLVIELDDPAAARVPAGIGIRPLRDLGEAPALHAALEEAFAEHWAHRPRPFEEYAKRTFHRPGVDLSLYWVALEGGEVVGGTLCDWKRQGDWGWVGIIGVRPPWRRRGIAEALLRTAFAEFARRGERRVALGVDAENPTGATRLYERLGMRRFWEAVVYEMELRG